MKSMNEKFYDLKKEKQDRMMNAGLRIFAANGYRHASTDDIVKEAQISKGLLFHYFGSKAGYYGFLYSYLSRFVILELRSSIRSKGMDFWELQKEILETETRIMEQYPAVFLFFESVKMETDIDALSALEELDTTVPDVYDAMYEQCSLEKWPRIQNPSELIRIIRYMETGLMRELLCDRSNPLSMYHDKAQRYLDFLQELAK